MAPSTLSDGRFSGASALRHVWHPVASEGQLGDGPIARTLCGTDLVLFRDGEGRAVALPDRCSHRNAPLSVGTVADGCVECPYHGWRFDGAGRCVEVPAIGPGPVPPKAHLTPFHATIRYGLVWVSLDEPRVEIPPCPWDEDDAYRRLNNPVEVWEASTTRMVDNFMDISHFPWVHIGSFGAAADRVVPQFELGPLPDGFTGYAYEVDAANQDGAAASGQTGAVVHRAMSTGFSIPFTVRSTIRYETGLEHILYLLTAPIDDERSYFTFVVWRNDDFSVPQDEVLQLDHKIASEDRWMLERVPGALPLGNDGVVSVRSDRPSVEWKRQLVQFLGSGAVTPEAGEGDTTAAVS
ncbi:MAG: aromatic ring-hydroxylating dioxygenase subunit alpha [Actinomycetota bacterium]|nr:aromatic ring-hydroxylating dioxygenase subunit alpha [Actinomycetota bacterium]